MKTILGRIVLAELFALTLAATAGADTDISDRLVFALSVNESAAFSGSSELEPTENRIAPKPATSGLRGAALAGLGGRTVFALANGNGSSSLVVSYFDSDSFISVKNVGTTIMPVTVEYSNLAGNDRTPGSNSFMLIDNGTARWAPSAGSPPSNDSMGNPIPVMLGPETEGSLIITSTAPLVGQLEIERIDETIAYSLADNAGSTSRAESTSLAVPTYLVVPYLRTGSIIALRNVGTAPANYSVEYRDLTGSIITTSAHSLASNATDRFAPFMDEPGLVGVEASAIIASDQPLAGQLELAGSVNNSGYGLQSASGSTTLVIPYVRAGSFIAITNSGTALANFTVEYRDLAGGSLVTSPHTLAAYVTERWAPFVDEPGVTGTEVSAVITSDQPLVGHLELRLPDGSTSASHLTAGTTPLAVPYMRAGSIIRVKCASGGATTVTVTYSSLAGATFTAPPRSISAGATDGWDPFAEEPGLAGMEEASADIVSADPLAGQLELAPGEPGPLPVAEFSATPRTGDKPLEVQFTDQSTGEITDWYWEFGDGGTSQAQNPSHTYNSAGYFTVSLTVSGPGGSNTETKTDYIEVTELPLPPVAAFSAAPTSGNRALMVEFTDESTGEITSRTWDFGDGGASTAQNPPHTYNSIGYFTVSLTVSGPGGSDTETKNNYIHVTEPPPVAAFTVSSTSGNRPLTVNFTDASSGSVTGWSWDFGDGHTSMVQNPSHTYYFTGDFTVTLAVSGPGGSDTESAVIHVYQALPAEKKYKTVIDDIKVSYNKNTCFACYDELNDTLLIAVWGEDVGTLNVTCGKNAYIYWGSRCDIVIDAPDATIKKINLKGRPETQLYVCGQVGQVENFALKYGSVGDTLYYGSDVGLGSAALNPPKKIAIKSGYTTAALLGVSYPDFRFDPAHAEDALAIPMMKLKSKPFEVFLDEEGVEYDELDGETGEEDDEFLDDEDVDSDNDPDDEAPDAALAGALAVGMKGGYKFEWGDIKVSYSKPGCLAYYNSSDGTLTIEIWESDGNLKVTCGKEAYIDWGDYCDIYIDAPGVSIKTINLKGRPQRGDDPGIQLHVCGEVGYVKNFKLKYGSVGDTDSYGPDFGLYNRSLEVPNKINITWGWTTAPLLGVSY